MNEPRDHSARRRFAEELDRNFSVVASAGSGKTQAITERVVQLAKSEKALVTLPKLVVVTFTHRAADEMQQRTRQRILQEHRSPALQAAFNRAFFGTIHSFCMKLLTNYGHYLGLPSQLDLVAEDDEELWEAFIQEHHHIGRTLSAETRTALFRLAPARQLMELGRNARSILSGRDENRPMSVGRFCPGPRGNSAPPFGRNDREFKSGVARLGETLPERLGIRSLACSLQQRARFSAALERGLWAAARMGGGRRTLCCR